jgi:hypothetical protein
MSPTTLAPGDTFTVNTSGWKPGADLTVTLNSTPVSLPGLTADSSGNATGSFTVPTDFPLGSHTLVIAGDIVGSSTTTTASASFTVAAASVTTTTGFVSGDTSPTVAETTTSGSTLPVTGDDIGALAGTALLLLGGGAAALTLARRRHDGPTER